MLQKSAQKNSGAIIATESTTAACTKLMDRQFRAPVKTALDSLRHTVAMVQLAP